MNPEMNAIVNGHTVTRHAEAPLVDLDIELGEGEEVTKSVSWDK